MKKFGKYEKMPDGTRAMQPAVKRTLLQTYLTSLLCMVLCVAMLFGTTFAWFTSEVTNSGNEIYIGTLDAKLEKLLDNDTWASLDSTEAGNDIKLFDGDIRWEPGYTSMETIKVSNEGDLSFRYALTFTDGLLNGAKNDAELIKVAQFFTVYVHAGEFTDSDPKPASFAEIKTSVESEDGTWRAVKMGEKGATLADILKIELPVLSGSMNAEDVRGDAVSQPALPGPNDSKATAHTYTIALHMNGEVMPDSLTPDEQKQWQDNLNDLMGNKIGLNVKLTAYQQTSEKDTFDNQYDANAKVPTIAPVKETISFTAYDLFGAGNGNTNHDITMNIYKFVAADFQDAYPVEEYSDWTCDFFVSSDAGVKDGLILVGNYDPYGWLGFHVPETNEPYPPTGLLGIVSSGGVSNWTYDAICKDVEIFSCGIHDSLNLNQGVEVTVELRMTSPNKSETITVASVIVTLPDL